MKYTKKELALLKKLFESLKEDVYYEGMNWNEAFEKFVKQKETKTD